MLYYSTLHCPLTRMSHNVLLRCQLLFTHSQPEQSSHNGHFGLAYPALRLLLERKLHWQLIKWIFTPVNRTGSPPDDGGGGGGGGAVIIPSPYDRKLGAASSRQSKLKTFTRVSLPLQYEMQSSYRCVLWLPYRQTIDITTLCSACFVQRGHSDISIKKMYPPPPPTTFCCVYPVPLNVTHKTQIRKTNKNKRGYILKQNILNKNDILPNTYWIPKQHHNSTKSR